MPARLTSTTLDLAGARVPALYLPVPGAERPPAALLLHGYSSRKERMADTIGVALRAQGIASLAIDLPLHGERAGEMDAQATRNPLALAQRWRAAIAECGAALAWLAKEADGERLALVGYSMGAFLACEVAARERSVKVMTLAAGGDLPTQTPFALLVRTVADPIRAVRRFNGPLLRVHGRRDTTVRPEQAERLFAAASEPKEIRWYDAGHYLPPGVIRDATAWMGERLGAVERPGAVKRRQA